MNITRPMRAVTMSSLDDIKFPVYVSYKLDGIRCIKVAGRALSKSMKPIVNAQLRALIEVPEIPDGFDGELWAEGMTFQEIESIVMTEDADVKGLKWYVFDWAMERRSYLERTICLENKFLYTLMPFGLQWLSYVANWCVIDKRVLEQHFNQSLQSGNEGLIIRNPHAPYKCGQSTMTKQELVKWKPMVTGKAIVLCAVEEMKNNNPAFNSELGLAKRSHKKVNKVPAGTLGSLLVRDLDSGIVFNIGTGFDDEQKALLWARRDTLSGTIVEYESQKCGVKEAPRCPVFKRFRNRNDICASLTSGK